MDRRSFLKHATAAAAVTATLPSLEAITPAATAEMAPAQPASAAAKPMIGIQVGAVSFVDEGVESVLDEFQRDAEINTLFIATFTYGRGIAGRQVPGQPLPDHGKQAYDTDTFHGGSFTRIDPKYFAGIPFNNFRAPDFGDFDVLDAVLPSAKKRGIKTICWFEDVFLRGLPGIDALEEVEFSGQKATTLCFNNPYYRAWLLGMAENWARNYPIDGIMWGSERQGAFANMLATNPGDTNTGRVTCFCSHCVAKAKARGIDPDRARKGFTALAAFINSSHAGRRPVDGYYVTLWRLMLRYSELLAWEMLWTDSLRETYAAIYAKVKEVNPSLQVGWHIWHTNSFSPIYRAEQDLAEIAPVSDFLKIVLYHNCGGERLARFIRTADSAMYADLPAEELLNFHYRVLNYDEKPLDQLPQSGLSADYVYRETKRARSGLEGTKTLLWPGIDIDIPTDAASSKSSPGGTEAAVSAAFRGGADGVLLSRKYSEMKLANLKGAGAAIRKLNRS